MLYMHIITWEPAQRDAVVKRAQAVGVKLEKGEKLIGFWNDLHGHRAFMLVDVPPAAVDAKHILEASWAWNDLCKTEVVPVMEFQEVMKLLPKT
jgi:hypothetical protein